MKLILTEKPSVARDIANVLQVKTKKEGYIEGNGYIISWALGHLIELCQPDEYNQELKQWQMETLPFIPDTFKTKVIDKSATQFNIIKSLIKNTNLTEVICATDAGREGELIFRLIYDETECELPIRRLWISSQTDSAIKEGFANLHPGKNYDALYDSAKSRSEADWIVGINATRAYSIKFSRGHGVMSVGRVQTPVLKLIVDRYREHIQFKSKAFHEIHTDIVHKNGTFPAIFTSENEERIQDKETADSIKKNIDDIATGEIASLTEKHISEKQPLLYDLTELQKDANRQFKFSADQTLKLMQSLYEKHKILSYPRTSSRYLSSDIAPKLPNLLSTIADLPLVKETISQIQKDDRTIAKRMIDDKKVTDHHAIIPTDKKPNLSQLSEDEKQIYDMVIKRFVASFLPECEKDHTEIISKFGPYTFKSTGTVIKKPGWRALYTDDVKSDKKKKETVLPIVTQGDVINHANLKVKKGQTKAPPLYTEASILAAMETAGKTIDDEELRQAMKQCGLGTPATRAQILEKLIYVKYITREKNKLTPTPKGEYIIDSIQDEMLGSPELTGEWEKQLNEMAQGTVDRNSFMNEIKAFTKTIIKNVAQSQHYAMRSDQEVLGECPLCKTGKIVEMKKSFSCTQWKSQGCKFVIWKEIAKKQITVSMAKTLVMKGKTATLKGFKNKQGNPFNASLVVEEGQIKMHFDKEIIGKCTLCDGNIVETPKAYSCDKWREKGCKFVIWKEISKRKITINEAKELIKEGKLHNLSGFIKRNGDSFSVGLQLKEGRVDFI